MRWQCFLALGLGFLGCASNPQTEEKKPGETRPPTGAAQEPSEIELKTLEDKASYISGLTCGKRLQNQAVKVNLSAVYMAVDDVLAGREPRLNDEEIREIRSELYRAKQEEQRRKAEELAAKNAAEGKAFLAKNKVKPGVVTLPSGLQYEVLTQGTGERPKVTDIVRAHYRGTLLDGTEFDSSYKRNKPYVTRLQGVIKGWIEALQLMPVGSKWKLYIPAELAYDTNGFGRQIGANATLVFEIELLGIQK